MAVATALVNSIDGQFSRLFQLSRTLGEEMGTVAIMAREAGAKMSWLEGSMSTMEVQVRTNQQQLFRIESIKEHSLRTLDSDSEPVHCAG